MSTQVSPFDSMKLPAGLISQEVLNLNKAITGGVGGESTNRLSIKGMRFRLVVAGQEKVLDQNYIDAVVVNAIPHVSRVWFKGAYNPEAETTGPTCRSRDGIKPDGDIPLADRGHPTACAACSNNIKGSGTNGTGKACSYKKRVVLIAASDLRDGVQPLPYAFDVNAMTIFGDGRPEEQKYSLQEYFKILAAPRNGAPSGIPVQCLVTRLSFDTSASVPKLFLSPSPGEPASGYASFLTSEQLAKVTELAKTEAVIRMLNEELVGAPVSEVPNQTPSLAAPQTQVAPIAPPQKTWQQIAAESGMDDDDIELVAGLGGPYTEAGAKRWMKLKGPALPVTAGAPVAAPTPVVKTPWADVAKASGMDDDDIELLASIGGPGTEKGLKFWNKNDGGDLADVDVTVVAEKKTKAKKPEAKTEPVARSFQAVSAPTTVAATAEVLKPITVTAGTSLASKLTAFDD